MPDFTFDPRFQLSPATVLNPDPGYKQQHQPKVLMADFGDGYGARAADGINNDPLNVPVTWTNVTKAERDYIVNFFKDRKGYQSFFWTLPDETTPKAWVCQQWDGDHQTVDGYIVSATLRQVFDLDTVAPLVVSSIVLGGDSQTANTGAYADQIIPDLTALGITCTKVAAGSRILGVSTDTTSVNSQWGHVSEIIAAAPQVYTHWLGHNDFGAYSAATANTYVSNTLAFFAYLKAALPNLKIVWIIPTNAGTNWVGDFTNMNAFIAALRPLIRAGVDSVHYDAFADFGAYPEFVDNLNANTSDGLHVAAGSSSGYLKNVLRAVVDAFINNYTGGVPGAINLGADLTGVGTNVTETMDVIVSGLAANRALTSAVATGGQIKQGFGAYGSSIGSGVLFNGDAIREQAVTSASLSTTTTCTLMLQPGSVGDSRSFTTLSSSSRSPPTTFDSTTQGQPTWATVVGAGLSLQAAVDVGAPSFCAVQQAMIGGRKIYFEVTINSVGSPSNPIISLLDSTLLPITTATPGQTVNPSHGISYSSTGVVWYNSTGFPASGSYTLFTAGDVIGVCAKDNGDGTTQVWFLDKNGNPLVAGDVPWSSGGKQVSFAANTLRAACGVRNADKVTINCTGPFVHKTAADLTAAGAHAYDDA
jgi:phage-related protein